MPWNEDDLHRLLSRRSRPKVLFGSTGHDAAVLKSSSRTGAKLVTCMDQTVEGVHFTPGTPGRTCARKAVARTFSDLAATAARPFAALLGVRAPGDRDSAWMRAVLLGAEAEAKRHGAELVGGDLSAASGPAALTVTALGRMEREGRARPPGRDRARAGQWVVLTGPCGGSLPSKRHLRPAPRFDEGAWLHRIGATAMMDVSDGVAIDLFRLARASKVQICLDRVPVHRDAKRWGSHSPHTATWHALHDGEDHELLATISRAAWKRSAEEARRLFPAIEVVGRVEKGNGLQLSPELALEAGVSCAWTKDEGGFLHGV